MTDYSSKIAELQADVQMIWKLQCQNLYNSKNLGALAVRECIQNSIDAITRAVRKGQIEKWEGLIKINFDSSSTVIVEDNGIGMDVKTIHDKFLSLGGTTKGDEDSVGGFGLAQAVILGCGSWFSIETQDNYLSSDDLGKNPISKVSYRQGTRITLKDVQTGKTTKVSDNLESFKYAVLEYVLSSDIPYRVLVNGTEYEPWFKKSRKTYRSPAQFNISSSMIPDDTKLSINVYKDKSNSSKYLWVRLRGLTQFKQYLGWNANCNIVLDFQTKLDPRSSEYPFSTNREGLKAHYQGITEAIRDKITQSPLSISSNDEFKETLFENATNDVKKERIISSCMNTEEVKELVTEVSKIVEGIQPQGGYTQPSVVDRAKQYQQQIKDLAQQEGKTVEEFVKTMDYKSIRHLNNPLEYSWLIWEDREYTGKKINKNKAVDIIIIWDSILRTMASRYSGLNGTVYYPGIIVKEDTLGMCVEKQIYDWENRCYIMINPFKIPVEDDSQIAIYLMGVAAHELAHLVCGSYEAHGETFSYTRETIMNESLSEIGTITKLIKAGKLRKKLGKLTKTGSSTSVKDNFPIDFVGKSLDEILGMAKDFGVDTYTLQEKYSDVAILKMRTIMAIKKQYLNQ